MTSPLRAFEKHKLPVVIRKGASNEVAGRMHGMQTSGLQACSERSSGGKSYTNFRVSSVHLASVLAWLPPKPQVTVSD